MTSTMPTSSQFRFRCIPSDYKLTIVASGTCAEKPWEGTVFVLCC